MSAHKVTSQVDALRVHLRTDGASDSRAWLQYAKLLVDDNNARAAFEAVKNALDLSPSNVEAVQLLGKIEKAIKTSGLEFAERASCLLRSVSGETQRIRETFVLWGDVELGDLELLAAHTPNKAVRTQIKAVVAFRRGELVAPPRNPRSNKGRSWLQAAIIAREFTLASRFAPRAAIDDNVLDSIRAVLHHPTPANEADALLNLLDVYLSLRPQDAWVLNKASALRETVTAQQARQERQQLTRNGLGLSTPTRATSVNVGNVLYILHESVPFKSNGYTARSDYLLQALIESGLSVRVVTRPGFGWEGESATPPNGDNNTYHRLPPLNQHKYANYVNGYAALLVKQAKEQRAGIVHAASNFGNGLAGVEAARRLGVPSVYEMRGLWHLTRASRDAEWEYGAEYQFCEQMELQAAQTATRVITLSDTIKTWLCARGVSPDKIDVIPNGVDTKRFYPQLKDDRLADDLGLPPASVVFGYVGSLVPYEGLQDLIEACRILYRWDVNASVLILGGDTETQKEYKALAKNVGVESRIAFVESIPPQEVPAYYALLDAVVLPRRMTRVTSIVPPLKILEPIAMGIPLVTTDLPPVREAVAAFGSQVTYCAPGEPGGLAVALRELTGQRLEQAARITAPAAGHLSSRSWKHAATQCVATYRKAAESTTLRVGGVGLHGHAKEGN